MPHPPIPPTPPRHKGCPPIEPIKLSTECPPELPMQPIIISEAFLKNLLSDLIRPLHWHQTGTETFEANTEIGLKYTVTKVRMAGTKNWASSFFGHGRGPFRDSKNESITDCEKHYQSRVLLLFDFNK